MLRHRKSRLRCRDKEKTRELKGRTKDMTNLAVNCWNMNAVVHSHRDPCNNEQTGRETSAVEMIVRIIVSMRSLKHLELFTAEISPKLCFVYRSLLSRRLKV